MNDTSTYNYGELEQAKGQIKAAIQQISEHVNEVVSKARNLHQNGWQGTAYEQYEGTVQELTGKLDSFGTSYLEQKQRAVAQGSQDFQEQDRSGGKRMAAFRG